ncbi:MAG: hypothetical protein AAGN82_06180 [Myxococcota bacterium]
MLRLRSVRKAFLWAVGLAGAAGGLGCGGDDGLEPETAEAQCRLQFELGSTSGPACPTRVTYLEDCQACLEACADCVVEFATCPPIIEPCE